VEVIVRVPIGSPGKVEISEHGRDAEGFALNPSSVTHGPGRISANALLGTVS